MRYLFPLLFTSLLLANEYAEPADTYINLGYKIGLVSENHSEHLDAYIDVQHRFMNALFAVGRYGTATKTQDTYNQQCLAPYDYTNLCPPSHVVDNSIDTEYIEYGISYHIIENNSGYGEFEIVNRTGLKDDYFDGITATIGYGYYLTPNHGVSIRSGISLATGWNISGAFFIKF